MITKLCSDKQEMKKFLEDLIENDIHLQHIHIKSFGLDEIEDKAFYRGSLDAYESILGIIKAI